MQIHVSQLLYVLFILANVSVYADEITFSSGRQQTVLIELYTSEGCNSCPPAEEYLNGLKRHQELWRVYIPVAFHVGYWDYLGWQDPYAHAAHAKRQSWYAQQNNLRTVYTPAFVVNGKAWRPGWFDHELPITGKPGGELKVTINDKQLTASFTSIISPVGKLTLNIAVLGMDLVSHIKAGENTGRTARHEFAVVRYKTIGSDNGHWATSLPALHYTAARQYALAVWVNHSNDPTPLQAVGGELPQFTEK
jgi:hypothetical protein